MDPKCESCPVREQGMESANKLLFASAAYGLWALEMLDAYGVDIPDELLKEKRKARATLDLIKSRIEPNCCIPEKQEGETASKEYLQ